MVLVGKLKDARINLDDLDNMMELGEEQVHQLEAFLDKILEKETAQRAEVTQMKEEFRTLKLQAQEKSAQLSFCWETIENRIAATEKMFSAFEEWMYASEFEKASEELEEIREALGDLTDIINNLPQLLRGSARPDSKFDRRSFAQLFDAETKRRLSAPSGSPSGSDQRNAERRSGCTEAGTAVHIGRIWTRIKAAQPAVGAD